MKLVGFWVLNQIRNLVVLMLDKLVLVLILVVKHLFSHQLVIYMWEVKWVLVKMDDYGWFFMWLMKPSPSPCKL